MGTRKRLPVIYVSARLCFARQSAPTKPILAAGRAIAGFLQRHQGSISPDTIHRYTFMTAVGWRFICVSDFGRAS